MNAPEAEKHITPLTVPPFPAEPRAPTGWQPFSLRMLE